MPDTTADALVALAQAMQASVDEVLPPRAPAPTPPPDHASLMGLYDALIDDEGLRTTTRKLMTEANYKQAVLDGCILLDNVVQGRSGLQATGESLMRTTFSPKNPLLRLSDLKSISKQDQQRGYMDMFAGCMAGIRNPHAHEHNYLNEPRIALEMLVLLNHLLRVARSATRTRKRRSP